MLCLRRTGLCLAAEVNIVRITHNVDYVLCRVMSGGRRLKKRYYIFLMIILCAVYTVTKSCVADSAYTDIIATSLTIIATVLLFMELKSNEQINEAQLIMELNNQFISNAQLSEVEVGLERYYLEYRKAKSSGVDVASITFGVDMDTFDYKRQGVVNYLVHLEGIAALVNEGVLHLNVITDLMAYRYFIAVNNPVIQEKELEPYKDYYQGIYGIYNQWSRKLGEDKVPMAKYALGKWLKEEERI